MARPHPSRRRPRLPHPRLIAAVALAAGACAAGPEVGPSAQTWELSDLVGSWSNGEMSLAVGEDGSYVVTTDNTRPVMSGFVARDRDRASFVTRIGGECSGTTGVYLVEPAGGHLILRLVEDPCQLRAEGFPGEWTRSGVTSSRSRATRSA